MRFKLGTTLSLAVILIVMSVPALSQQKGIFLNPVEPRMTPRLNLGKLSYDAFCASCHGKTGGGSDKGPTFISRIYHPGHHSDGAFVIATKRGARAHHWPFGDMKPVKGINEAQISTIVEYVRAVQKANGLF
jgi:cytochrome c553